MAGSVISRFLRLKACARRLIPVATPPRTTGYLAAVLASPQAFPNRLMLPGLVGTVEAQDIQPLNARGPTLNCELRRGRLFPHQGMELAGRGALDPEDAVIPAPVWGPKRRITGPKCARPSGSARRSKTPSSSPSTRAGCRASSKLTFCRQRRRCSDYSLLLQPGQQARVDI